VPPAAPAMAQYGSDPDDGGSLAGSPANSSLTGDKLRRRPAHSRKASLESLDLENDILLPAALQALQILPGASGNFGAGRPPRGRAAAREGASARESVASADESVARDGSSGESSRAAEVTSAEKPSTSSGTKIRAIVASGGALYDKPDGSRGYRGGDTRLVSIRRGATFDTLVTLLDETSDDETSDDARLAKRKKNGLKVYYRDPNDGVTLLRVARDADIDEMFEEWDRKMAIIAREAGADAAASAAAAAEKLKVYVCEKSDSADSGAGTPRDSRAAAEAFRKDTDRERVVNENAKSASKASGLQNVPSAELTLVHRLGGGAFGEVHLALWRGSEVAVKFLHARRERLSRAETREARLNGLARVSEKEERDLPTDFVVTSGSAEGDSADSDREEDLLDAREASASRESFLKEARVMAALHHPNVVFVYGVVDDGDRLGIVEEFMRSGSLRRLLNLHVREASLESLSLSRAAEDEQTNGNGESKKNAPPLRGKRHLSLSVRARCALDVARGMAYLHSRRFVHFDLKCDNVLTARQLGVAGGVTCKVADFGLSKQQRGGSVVGSGVADAEARQFTSGIASQRGTLPWTAPELFSDPANATESVDAYSFGVCMWELWTCDVPFKDMREQSVVWGIMTGKRPELPPADLDEPCVGWRDLMTALWREDPKSRPTFDETVRVLEEALTKTNAENGARCG
jgi:serine/threonine protein kinase